MLLVKSCESRFNPKISRTVKIGSLYEYRDTEIEEIADRQEGFFDFTLRIVEPTEVPNYWYNAIMQGQMAFGNSSGKTIPRFPGVTRVFADKLFIVSMTGTHSVLANTNVNIHREDVNGLIFCMSLLPSTSDASAIFSGYDDCWSCSASDANAIAEGLGNSVRSLAVEAFLDGNLVIPKGFTEKDISIHVRHGLVVYTDREMDLPVNGIFDLEGFYEIMSDMSFIKPRIPFSKEKEYRFHFCIMVGGMLIQPWSNTLIVDSASLDKIIL